MVRSVKTTGKVAGCSLVHNGLRSGSVIRFGFILLALLQGSYGDASAQSFSREQVRVDGGTRSYLLGDYASGGRAPLLIVLHGGGGSPRRIAAVTGFDEIAKREHFIVAYPEGFAQRNSRRKANAPRTWNAGHCCAQAMLSGSDDVSFLSAIIDTLIARGRVDPDRVYIAGFSNGAMMAHRAGRELSTKVAGIAAVAGAVFGNEPLPQTPVAALIINSARDPNIPAAGGRLRKTLPGLARSPADRDFAPAAAQVAYWSRANGCKTADTTSLDGVTVVSWSRCTGDAEVVFYNVLDAGHIWPGSRIKDSGRRSDAIDASETIWAFFKVRKRCCS